jgi:hypothetical protein
LPLLHVPRRRSFLPPRDDPGMAACRRIAYPRVLVELIVAVVSGSHVERCPRNDKCLQTNIFHRPERLLGGVFRVL